MVSRLLEGFLTRRAVAETRHVQGFLVFETITVSSLENIGIFLTSSTALECMLSLSGEAHDLLLQPHANSEITTFTSERERFAFLYVDQKRKKKLS